MGPQNNRRRPDHKADLALYVEHADFEAFVRKMDTALFAKTDDNENGQRGLMVIAARMDAHITMVCTAARWTGATIAAAAAAATMGRSFGLWG